MYFIEQCLTAEAFEQIKREIKTVIGENDKRKNLSIKKSLSSLYQKYGSYSLADLKKLKSSTVNTKQFLKAIQAICNNIQAEIDKCSIDDQDVSIELITFIANIKPIIDQVVKFRLLPNEILYLINSYLDCTSQLQLRFVNTQLHTIVSLPLDDIDLRQRWQFMSRALGNAFPLALEDIQALQEISANLYVNQPATVIDDIRSITGRYNIGFNPRLNPRVPLSDWRTGNIIKYSSIPIALLVLVGGMFLFFRMVGNILSGKEEYSPVKFWGLLAAIPLISGLVLSAGSLFCIAMPCTRRATINESMVEQIQKFLKEAEKRIERNVSLDIQFNKTIKWLALLSLRHFEREPNGLSPKDFLAAFKNYISTLSIAKSQSPVALSEELITIQDEDPLQQDLANEQVMLIQDTPTIDQGSADEHVITIGGISTTEQFFYNKLAELNSPRSNIHGFFNQVQRFRQYQGSEQEENIVLASASNLNTSCHQY